MQAALRRAKTLSSETELSYEPYSDWYAAATGSYLEPARLAAVRMLTELLDTKIDSVDRGRFRISTSRVKGPQRSFAKLNLEKYRPKFTTYELVPALIDDLVGMRLICNNLSDINTFQEVIGELPIDDGKQVSLSVERDSHRDYFAEPKASGYRAFHVNFVIPVPLAHGTKRVRVEAQVRTLLQDGWGELTHEDTYKPGSSVPDWIVRMSLRMADLLAAIDDIAQDLRTGLDIESQRAMEEDSGEPAGEPSSAHPSAVSQTPTTRPQFEVDVRRALVKEANGVVKSLNRATGLSSLSQTLTATFGSDITQLWSQSGGFKRFLELEVPGIVITGPMPGYVHPAGADISSWPVLGELAEGVPDIVRELRIYEKALPLISPERMSQVIAAVETVINGSDVSPTESGRISSAQLAVFARLARAHGEDSGHLIVRPHAQYVLLALNRAGKITVPVIASEIRASLQKTILAQLRKNGLLRNPDVSRSEVSRWLGGP